MAEDSNVPEDLLILADPFLLVMITLEEIIAMNKDDEIMKIFEKSKHLKGTQKLQYLLNNLSLIY